MYGDEVYKVRRRMGEEEGRKLERGLRKGGGRV